MEQFLPVIIACIAALIALCSFILGAFCVISFNGFKRDYEAESADLIRTCDKLRSELLDLKNAGVLLGTKIKEQDAQIAKLYARLDEVSLNSQDSDSKLYTRAKKMIELGADLDEVVRECEIPQGEAELLFRVQGKPIKSIDTNAQVKVHANSVIKEAPRMPDFGGFNGISREVMLNSRAQNTDMSAKSVVNAVEGEISTVGGAESSVPKEASGLMEHFKNKKQ